MPKCILLLLISGVSISATIAQSCQITGWVKDYFTHKPLDSVEVLLITPVSDKTVQPEYFWRKMYTLSGMLITHPDSARKVEQRTFTNSRGYFHLDNNVDTPYNVICVYHRLWGGTPDPIYHDFQPYLDSAELTDNAARGIYYIRATCNYDQTKGLKHCPKCHKKDKIIQTLAGLPYMDMDGNVHGNDGKIIKEYYPLGCDPDFRCLPTKYCKRCDLLF